VATWRRPPSWRRPGAAICAIFDAGEETAAISVDREVFEHGIAHEDGAITLQLGIVEFVIARRE
jgi:hypothetical protein